MKLMIIIVGDNDVENTLQALVQSQHRVTRMASTGGFLRRGNSTLLVGVEDEQVEPVLELLRKACCRDSSETQHRTTVFVVAMQHYAKI